MGEPLTIENLAKSIHVDELAALRVSGLAISCRPGCAALATWDELHPDWKACRREQARLMLERWLR